MNGNNAVMEEFVNRFRETNFPQYRHQTGLAVRYGNIANNKELTC